MVTPDHLGIPRKSRTCDQRFRRTTGASPGDSSAVFDAWSKGHDDLGAPRVTGERRNSTPTFGAPPFDAALADACLSFALRGLASRAGLRLASSLGGNRGCCPTTAWLILSRDRSSKAVLRPQSLSSSAPKRRARRRRTRGARCPPTTTSVVTSMPAHTSGSSRELLPPRRTRVGHREYLIEIQGQTSIGPIGGAISAQYIARPANPRRLARQRSVAAQRHVAHARFEPEQVVGRVAVAKAQAQAAIPVPSGGYGSRPSSASMAATHASK
jgi:hypothetical protein